MKDIPTLRLYTRVARLGSFSAAARETNLAQSQVSRMIADLEAGLGVRLLSRTTRAVVPTEAGIEFLARIEPILAALDDAENSVRETGELRGRLRIAMPSIFGIRVLIPRLTKFIERHPKLHLETILEDQWQDLVRGAIDIGFRVGELPDASGTAKLIGKMHRITVAAPSYLEKHGTPATPAELHRHRIIVGPHAMHASSWQYRRDGRTDTIDVEPHFTTNDTSGALAAATSGLGLTSTTTWASKRELDSGALVRLLPAWTMAELPVHAYFPLGRATRVAARVFVDFVSEEFARD
ncbi:LysR family transcriptional regulator [Roseiterribacter gracilis]|uniref:LysR family transcriptional regulator n=1 Tax=Roseiterribacter gracilis TaxID=2812848 RepID=A0A8S8X8B3_9PROT|nr:LysR family transcriptional regulator [Rhodospirillales bacterium TMPK1]